MDNREEVCDILTTAIDQLLAVSGSLASDVREILISTREEIDYWKEDKYIHKLSVDMHYHAFPTEDESNW